MLVCNKILVVTTSVPFPPRQGVELFLSNLIKCLAVNYNVDLLVLGSENEYSTSYIERKDSALRYVSNVYYARYNVRSKMYLVVREVLGIASTFYHDLYEEEYLSIFKGTEYQAVWVSPIGALGFVNSCKINGINLSDTIALGHNDPEVMLNWDTFKQLLTGHVPFEYKKLFRVLRIPLIWMYEKRYLRDISVIHVQTRLEKSWMNMILGNNKSNVKIINASTGRNEMLLQSKYKGIDSQNVMYMTHLAGGRKNESVWFLSKIWPLVLSKVPDATLYLVGTPPDAPELYLPTLPKNVIVTGFVQNLLELYESVAITVVPTHHGTGWATRVADSINAGVPVVACSEPIRTIPGIKVGVHALMADSHKLFAENIVSLLSDRNKRIDMSKNMKELSVILPSWEQTTARIVNGIEELIS